MVTMKLVEESVTFMSKIYRYLKICSKYCDFVEEKRYRLGGNWIFCEMNKSANSVSTTRNIIMMNKLCKTIEIYERITIPEHRENEKLKN